MVAPRGTPDGGYQNYQVGANQSDPGTSTDRLLMGGGSSSRTGRVVWATGFEDGVGADVNINDTTRLSKIYQGTPFSFPSTWQGLYVWNFLTNSVNSNAANLLKYFPSSLLTGKPGLEFMIDLEVAPSTFDFSFLLIPGYATGKPAQNGTIRIIANADYVTVKFYYLNSAGGYVQFADASNIFPIGLANYVNLKLVIDPANDLYSKFYYNNKKYDLSAFHLYDTAIGSGTPERSQISWTLTTNAAAVASAYMDNVILTADEP